MKKFGKRLSALALGAALLAVSLTVNAGAAEVTSATMEMRPNVEIVVDGVARRAKAAGVPLVALVGQIGQGFEPMYDLGLSAVFSINRAAQPLAQSAPHAAENLRLAAENVLRLWQAAQPE